MARSARLANNYVGGSQDYKDDFFHNDPERPPWWSLILVREESRHVLRCSLIWRVILIYDHSLYTRCSMVRYYVPLNQLSN